MITTAYSFFATAGCVARVGARPFFVDVDPATLNLSPAALERFLNEECEREGENVIVRKTKERVRAIIPVHLFGLCCELNPIHVLSEKYGLDVIEDAAQAIGAEYRLDHMGVRQAGTMARQVASASILQRISGRPATEE